MGVQLSLPIVLKWPASTSRTRGHWDSWWVVADYLTDVLARHFPAPGQEMVFKNGDLTSRYRYPSRYCILDIQKRAWSKNIFMGTILTNNKVFQLANTLSKFFKSLKAYEKLSFIFNYILRVSLLLLNYSFLIYMWTFSKVVYSVFFSLFIQVFLVYIDHRSMTLVFFFPQRVSFTSFYNMVKALTHVIRKMNTIAYILIFTIFCV